MLMCCNNSCHGISIFPSSFLIFIQLLSWSKEVYIFVQLSLYEDLVAAWVPAKHDWLQKQPLGEELVSRLGKHRMFSYCASKLFTSCDTAVFGLLIVNGPLISAPSQLKCR